MIAYLIIFFTALLSGFFIYKDCKRTWFWISLGAIIISLIIGLRYNVGIDWLHFHQMYNRINFGLDVDVEIGYKYMSLFFGRYLGYGSWTIFTFMALCFIFPIYIIGKKYKKIAYIMVPIYLFMNLTNSLTVSRQYAAMGLLILAFRFLVDNDKNRYLIFSVLAICLHTTAILYVVLFFIVYKCNFIQHRCLYVYFFLFIISIVFFNKIESLLPWIYDNFVGIGAYIGRKGYAENEEIWESQLLMESGGSIFSYYMSCLSTGLLIFYGDRLLRNYPNKILFFIYHITVISNILLPIFISQELLKRMLWYMTIFTPIIYAFIYDIYLFRNNKKVNIGSCLLIVNLLYMFYSYLAQGVSMNYRFI